VIHNVGNVLTNVNSLLDAACDRTAGLRIAPLQMLASRLNQSQPDAGLLQATPGYLERLAGSLKSDQQAISQLLATLDDNIRHIHDVIRAQQRHTNRSIKTSRFPLRSVIDEAITCCRARLEEDSVDVLVDGDLSIQVETDRSLMLQVMINIIGNARQATRQRDPASRLLLVQVRREGQAVQIRFRDNGCGMPPETLEKVFDAHFTTRPSGSGLGLHFCAITLKRLDGSIRGISDGPGSGATFVVELPLGGGRSDQTTFTEDQSEATGAGAIA
jgi:signal transduction histidine kinase